VCDSGVTRVDGDTAGSPGTITSAILEDQGSQRRYIIKAKQYIDATGDGRLGAEAGAEWIQGREGAAKYNESLAKLELTEFPTDEPGVSHPHLILRILTQSSLHRHNALLRSSQVTSLGGPDHETEGTTLDYTAEAKTTARTYRAPFWASKFNK